MQAEGPARVGVRAGRIDDAGGGAGGGGGVRGRTDQRERRRKRVCRRRRGGERCQHALFQSRRRDPAGRQRDRVRRLAGPAAHRLSRTRIDPVQRQPARRQRRQRRRVRSPGAQPIRALGLCRAPQVRARDHGALRVGHRLRARLARPLQRDHHHLPDHRRQPQRGDQAHARVVVGRRGQRAMGARTAGPGDRFRDDLRTPGGGRGASACRRRRAPESG